MKVRSHLRFLKRASRLLRDWNFYHSLNVSVLLDNDEVLFCEYSNHEIVEHLMSPSGISFDELYFDRFTIGDTFVCLVNDENELLSFGWSTNRCQMPVSELGLQLNSGGASTLYDFHTPDRFRRRGYYTCLLKHLVRENPGCWIYAHKDNLPSCRAIERSGFGRESSMKMLCTGQFSMMIEAKT